MTENKNLDVFTELYDIDLREKMYQKQGLSYVPWATAWAEVQKKFPNATYDIKKFGENEVPYLETDIGYMVFTSVTIGGITHEMWLPVMDGSNKAMKREEYTYKVTKNGKAIEKTVASATMFDINKTLMRCLTKNLAMFGLGLHLWSKEEAPESVIECEKLREECVNLIKKKSALSEKTKDKVGEVCKNILPEENGDPRICEDNEKLKELKKKLMSIRKIA